MNDSDSSSNLREIYMRSTLGSKLQRLALLNPSDLGAIEALADLMLKRLNEDRTKVLMAIGLLWS